MTRKEKDQLVEIVIMLLIFIPIRIYLWLSYPFTKSIELYNHITGKDLLEQISQGRE